MNSPQRLLDEGEDGEETEPLTCSSIDVRVESRVKRTLHGLPQLGSPGKVRPEPDGGDRGAVITERKGGGE